MSKEKEEIIRLDEDGYNQYLEEIEQIKNKLNKNNSQKNEAFHNAVGDGWHDNFAFEEAKREEYKIVCELRDKLAKLSRIVVINKKETQTEKIANINDYVLVNMSSSKTQPKDSLLRLVATTNPDIYSDIREVTINSPLGKTIYQKPEGYQGQYSVNGNTITVELKQIGKSLEDIEIHTAKKSRG